MPAIELTKNPQQSNHCRPTLKWCTRPALSSAPSAVGVDSWWPANVPVSGAGWDWVTVAAGPSTRTFT